MIHREFFQRRVDIIDHVKGQLYGRWIRGALATGISIRPTYETTYKGRNPNDPGLLDPLGWRYGRGVVFVVIKNGIKSDHPSRVVLNDACEGGQMIIEIAEARRQLVWRR